MIIQKRLSRWFRFSLRTFFIVLTIFSVWLGIRVNSARQQAKAVAAIKAMGGNVYFDFHFAETDFDPTAPPRVPQWLWPVFGKGSVECVDFTLVPATDQDLNELPNLLKPLPNFRLLSLDRTNIGDPTLRRLAQHCNFEVLNIDGTRVTDRGLEYILEMSQLKGLSIVFANQVSEVGLTQLSNHPSLERVSWNTQRQPAETEWAAYNRLVNQLQIRAAMTEKSKK